MHAGLKGSPLLAIAKSAKAAGLQNLTPSAELDRLTPARHQVLPVALLHGSLHCHTVFSAGTQEPVASHRHRQWHSLGTKLGGDILRSEVQTESQESKWRSRPPWHSPRPPTPPMATFLLKIAGVSRTQWLGALSTIFSCRSKQWPLGRLYRPSPASTPLTPIPVLLGTEEKGHWGGGPQS